jgi:tetratricopeptide (TPR) repeat protein
MKGRVLLGAFVAAIAAWMSVAAFGHAVAQGDPRNRCLDGGARPDETVAACNDAINRYPNDAVLWNSRAVEREKQGRLDSALANLNTAIRLKPDYGLAYANRGRIYVQKGDYAHALRDLDEAIRLSPKHSEALYLRGTAKEKLGDVRNALDDYEKAAQLNPSYEEALKAAKRVGASLAEPAAPDANSSTDAARCVNMDIGDASGIPACENAIKKSPRDANLWNTLGDRHFRQGIYDRAVADYSETVKLDPKHPTAYFGLASTWEKKGDLQLAQEFLRLHKKQEAAAPGKAAPPARPTRDPSVAKAPPPISVDDVSGASESFWPYLPQAAMLLVILGGIVGVGVALRRKKPAPVGPPALAPPPFAPPRKAGVDYPPASTGMPQRLPPAAPQGPLQQNEVRFMVEALESLCRLHEQGVLSESEFIKEKQRVLGGQLS